LKGHVIWVYGPLSDGATAYIREINSLLTAECKSFTSVRTSLQWKCTKVDERLPCSRL